MRIRRSSTRLQPDARRPDGNRGLSAAELMQKRAAEEVARKEALHVIERRNAERLPLWSPTIRCAVVAGTPWLDVYCPGCRTSRAIDIRTLDRHPLASVGSLVLGLRCSWCPGNAPMPVSPGCTRCRRPRGGAKVCQWNSCTAALSAQRTLKGSAWRLSLSTTSMSSMTKYAVSWLATGLTCWRNFRRTKTDGEKDAVGIADAIGRPRQMTIINESGLYLLVKEADGECAVRRSPCPHPSLSYVGPANTSAQPSKQGRTATPLTACTADVGTPA